jgi:hypothetical protein
MGVLKTFAATAALAAFIPNSAALNVDSKSNVAVYYVSLLLSKGNAVSASAYSEF